MKNDTLYWHIDNDTKEIWCWCNKCDRGYSVANYCELAGVDLKSFLSGDFDFRESKNNQVQRMEWPRNFVALTDARAKPGVEYLKSRGLDVDIDIWYDTERKGIVFPYYVHNTFVGAQIRMITPYIDKDGNERKIDTMPGTRLGLLFFGWNQKNIQPHIRGVIVTEGAFNAIAIQQSLDAVYGENVNPWKCIAASGSGASSHQMDCMKELVDKNIKVIVAPDFDKAGQKMMKKFKFSNAATHYAFTENENIDWNDAAKAFGKEEFATWFLKQIKPI